MAVDSSSRVGRLSRLRRAMLDVFLALAVGALAISAVVFLDPLLVGGAVLVVSATFLLRQWVFRWSTMLILLVAVVMFVPIRRYALPINVGPELEPYRVLIMVLLIAIAIAALDRSRFPWQPSVWAWPIAIFLWTLLSSLMFNAVELTLSGRIMGGLSSLIQLAALLSVAVIVRQLLRSERLVSFVINLMVFGATIIGIFSLAERYIGFNLFLQYHHFLPLTLLNADPESLVGPADRALGSAQHPIGLSVLFCLIIPLAIYQMKFGSWPRYLFTRRLVYGASALVMLLGLLSSVSRTGVVVLAVMFLFVLALRPRLALTLTAFGLPGLTLLGLVLPQLFERTVGEFFDLEALVESQHAAVGMTGQGRLADLPEAFQELSLNPWTGTGMGSRQVVGDDANAQLLDNEWLSILLEAGVIGVLGLIALLAYPVLAMVKFAFYSAAPDSRKFLAFAIAASTVGYITSMFFFDAFAFQQSLLVLAILYGISAWAMTDGQEEWSHTPAEAEKSPDSVGSRA